MPNDQVGQAYRDAKIVLNDHWDDMKETGIVSNRLFDALAAEAFIISDEMPEIEEIFEGTVVTYKDCKDLKEKVDYYGTSKGSRKTRRKRPSACAGKAYLCKKNGQTGAGSFRSLRRNRKTAAIALKR